MKPSGLIQEQNIATHRTDHPKCPLCDGTNSSVAGQFGRLEIKRAWKVMGFGFSDRALTTLLETDGATLFECQRCGFRFFDGNLAGDGAFYSELQSQSQTYYVGNRAEFFWATRLALKHQLRTVLDVGCGAGAFLDLARSHGLETHGIELNPLAAEGVSKRGHTVYRMRLDELAGQPSTARFDLITMFQVLEHVSDPVGFLTDATKLLAKDGCIAIAVPNEFGIGRLCPWDPHQWPPHHVTRWRPWDLRRLGERCGVNLLWAGSDRVGGFDFEHFWTMHNKLAAELGKKPHPGGKILPAALSFAYRKTGCKYFFPRFGPSIYGFYRKH